jgi:ParB family chromosome partitioning protein
MSRKALGRGLSALFTQIESIETDLVDIDIERIDPAAFQPRHLFNEGRLDELARSIKANGIIQPLVVRRNGERFQLIAGERRWRAAAKAGLKRVPCIIRDVASDRVLEMSLIENIQREELNPIEEANAYRKLVDQLRLTQEEIAQRVGKDRTSITNSLRLLKLPQDVQALVEESKIAMGHARALLSLGSPEEQKRLAAEIVTKAWSVRETEDAVKRALGAPATASRRTRPSKQPSSERANIASAELKLSRKLAAPVRIRFGGHGGAIEIKFSSSDDLARLFDLLIQRLR